MMHSVQLHAFYFSHLNSNLLQTNRSSCGVYSATIYTHLLYCSTVLCDVVEWNEQNYYLCYVSKIFIVNE